MVSGFGSISPGLSFRGSSVVSSSLSLWAVLSLGGKKQIPDEFSHSITPFSMRITKVLALALFLSQNKQMSIMENSILTVASSK